MPLGQGQKIWVCHGEVSWDFHPGGPRESVIRQCKLRSKNIFFGSLKCTQSFPVLIMDVYMTASHKFPLETTLIVLGECEQDIKFDLFNFHMWTCRAMNLFVFSYLHFPQGHAAHGPAIL
jgi:hypothetical protein